MFLRKKNISNLLLLTLDFYWWSETKKKHLNTFLHFTQSNHYEGNYIILKQILSDTQLPKRRPVSTCK